MADIIEAIETSLTKGDSNSSSEPDLGDEIFSHDEFFQDKEAAPVSEFYACKQILYSTVGTSNVKAYDVWLLVPALLFLLCLVYTSPRGRHKLSGASSLVTFLHFLTMFSTAVSVGRSLIVIALPTQKDSSNTLEKVTWTFTRSSLLALELTAVLNFMFTTLPNARNSRRLLGGMGFISIMFFIITLVIELGAPSAAFHLFEKGYFLYGEGGGLYTALVFGSLCLLHVIVLSIRLKQHQSSPGRKNAIICSGSLLLIDGLRSAGGLALLGGLQGGICLTSITLYLHTVGLAPLSFVCVILPYLRHGQGHSLLTYEPQLNQWEEEDVIVSDKLGDSGRILRNESVADQIEDDY